MIYNTERAGRSAYYERPAKERKRAKESLRKMKICTPEAAEARLAELKGEEK